MASELMYSDNIQRNLSRNDIQTTPMAFKVHGDLR